MKESTMNQRNKAEENLAETKETGIYIRVSTEFQAEEGYSIEAQKEQLTEYCNFKGIKQYEFYIDGGWTGSNMNRPELIRMINDIKNGKIDCCLVYKLDRLSRSQKDILCLIEDVFIPYNCRVCSLTEEIDTQTPSGRAFIGILASIAQLERENISMRTRMGMLERVKNGFWMGGGRTPFGYDYDKNAGILVPNQDAEKVKQIFDLYIDGYSAQHIANMLGMTYDRYVIGIIKRKTYYGAIEYKGEVYQGRHEGIISKETYDLAMAEYHKRSVTNLTTSNYLLTGLVYCGKCGAKMRYQKWGKKGQKLVCYSQQKSKPYLVKDLNCDQKKIWADDLEEIVVKKILLLKERLNKKATPKVVDNSDILVVLEKQQTEHEIGIKRLYNLYAKNGDERILESIEDLKKKLDKVNRMIKSEKQRRQDQAVRKRLYKSLNSLEEEWDILTGKEKQHILRNLVGKIIVTDDKVEIQLLF